jgi:addiction module HigA family antidote
MATKSNRITPFRAVHPGEILREELQERGLKQKDFAERIGMSASHLNEFINGKRNLNEGLAIKLEQHLDIPFATWMSLQNSYIYDCKAIGERKQMKVDASAKSIAETVKTERKRAGLTQEQLAEKTGVNKAYISRIETGNYDVQMSMLFRIFDGLGRRVSLTIV